MNFLFDFSCKFHYSYPDNSNHAWRLYHEQYLSSKELREYMSKYGKDDILWRIYSYHYDLYDLQNVERELIEEIGAVKSDKFYNKRDGGTGGGKHCASSIKKMSEVKKGKSSPNKGKKINKPAWNRGKTTPAETRKKLSISAKKDWEKRTKFNISKCKKIRAEFLGGELQKDLAIKYNCCALTISKIIKGNGRYTEFADISKSKKKF